MENFNYVRPAKVADAVKAMKKAKDGKFMSGGQTLIPTLKQGLAAPTDIIDLGDITTARGTEMYLSLWVRLMSTLGTAQFSIKVVR